MNQDKKPHFWIPNEEIEQVTKKPMAISTPRDVVYSEHGSKLSHSLQVIKQKFEETVQDNSLLETNICVFKVELPKGEKIQHQATIFSANGMHINAVKDERRAIVSTTKQQFEILKNRVNAYTRGGTNRTYFDMIEDFSPYVGSEKNSSELRKMVYSQQAPQNIDIQLMFIPNLKVSEYEIAIKSMLRKIEQSNGEIQQEPYLLTDKTPVIRAIIPSSTLMRYENDSAVYRIEETHFFSVDIGKKIENCFDLKNLDQSVDMKTLPIVAVLDSGVNFQSPFDNLVVNHWLANGSKGGDYNHGTRVASKVIFGTIGKQIEHNILVPRARVIDCNILDGSVAENILIKRIQEAVIAFADVTKIFNLSANSKVPVEGDEMSIIGYEIDALQLEKGVQFVLSAGNHNLWKTESSLEDILDDDDSKIAAPADSMLGIVVGAVVGETHSGSIASANMITPYSRRGPGFAGFSKPDISAYGGTLIVDSTGTIVPEDSYSLVFTKDAKLEPDAGTSFTAPVVAGDLAEILNIVPQNDILLAKALLYHNANPIWEADDMDDDELAFAHNLYGRGISTVDSSKYSSASKVTFMRSGILNRLTKERIKIYMPEILAAQQGRNVAKVTVTCVSTPPIDRTKGSEYLGAYIRASLKKSHPDGRLLPVPQSNKEGRKKWDVCHQFSKIFSRFNSGDWQIWLEMFSRWEDKDMDVPYALIVTIEDISGTLDIYSEIEALNRYRTINTLRVKVDA